ncbi:uncharacterized protein H6S33_002441 [Morchella sextelata]|uniref:uncharacterized protein n=1 Tax=Morchella sextelata TaxID=1174677 RepID=UPI001D03B0E5|nr:uncharacterized protein H6S33_002441 [Morchella sextelata]KAH0607407.1 hypothetical protein H6S33_002441 [Morchella sextelata]
MNLISLSILLGAAGIASAAKISDHETNYPAIAANDRFPFASQMGPFVSGASVNNMGELFAVNQTAFMSLRNGDVDPAKPLVHAAIDGSVSFTDSRFTRHGSASQQLITDAAGHSVWLNMGASKFQKRQPNCRGRKRGLETPPPLVKRDTTPLFVEADMIQPNSIALHSDERHIYLAGGLGTSTTSAGVSGDLWWYDAQTEILQKVDINVMKAGGIHRVNAIEVSNDDKYLYVTAGETEGNSITATKIFRFVINPDTFAPEEPTLILDIYAALTELGIDGKHYGTEAMGLRSDVDGNIFVALNRGKAILKWKVEDPAATAELMNLASVAFPVSLELGGDEGKTLYILGRCSGGTTSCVDVYNHDVPGRAWANLNGKNKNANTIVNANEITPPSQHEQPQHEQEGVVGDDEQSNFAANTDGSSTATATTTTTAHSPHNTHADQYNHDILDPVVQAFAEIYDEMFGSG